MKSNFYTFNTYLKNEENLITATMEDYIEMIYRLSEKEGSTRVGDLSKALNVQPPSISKMIKRLVMLDMTISPKYGYIKLTEVGKEYGLYLLNRHKTIEKFLSLIGVKESLLEETEKIEHVLNKETLECIMKFIDKMEQDKT